MSPITKEVYDWCIMKLEKSMYEFCVIHRAHFRDKIKNPSEYYWMFIERGEEKYTILVRYTISRMPGITQNTLDFTDSNIENNRYYELLLKNYLKERGRKQVMLQTAKAVYDWCLEKLEESEDEYCTIHKYSRRTDMERYNIKIKHTEKENSLFVSYHAPLYSTSYVMDFSDPDIRKNCFCFRYFLKAYAHEKGICYKSLLKTLLKEEKET